MILRSFDRIERKSEGAQINMKVGIGKNCIRKSRYK